MYARQLGVAPLVIVKTGADLVNIVTGLFKHSIDSTRKARLDGFGTRVMANLPGLNDPTSDAYNAYMRLRCESGDSSAAVVNWYNTHTGDGHGTATACGCATPECKAYATSMLTEIGRAARGLPPTPLPPSNGGIIPGVTIPVPINELELFGIPAIPLLIGGGLLLFMMGTKSRGRA